MGEKLIKQVDTIKHRAIVAWHRPQVRWRIKWGAVFLLVINLMSWGFVPYFLSISREANAADPNMMLFWDGNCASPPTNWTVVSDANGEAFYDTTNGGLFPRGNTTYGRLAGGALTHTHTGTLSQTATTGTTRTNTGSGSQSTTAHVHTFSTPTVAATSSLPAYKTLCVIQYTGIPTTIPNGAIAIFDNTVPVTDWSDISSSFGTNYIRGSNSAGSTGGSNTHAGAGHSVTTLAFNASGNTTTKTGSTGSRSSTAGHTHTVANQTSDTPNTEPQYITVILGKATADTAIPTGMIAMFDGSGYSASVWDTRSDSGDDFYQRFIKVTGTYGTKSGANTHTHAAMTGTTGSGGGDQTGGSGSSGIQSHTHDFSLSLADGTNTNNPPYTDVVFAQKLAATINVSGTTNVTSGTVKVAVNGSVPTQSGGTISGGTWQVTGITQPASGAIITAWVDGAALADETTGVAKYSGSGDMTDMVLTKHVLSIGGVGNQSISVSDMVTANYDHDNNGSIMHTANTSTLTVDGGNEYSDETIDILTSDTLTVETSGTLSSLNVTITGTLTSGGNSTYNIYGNWTNNGAFTQSTSTVNFMGSSTQTIGGSATTTFNNVATSNTANATTGIATNIGGTLVIGNSSTFTNAGHAMTVTGATTVGGGTSGSLVISNSAGTKTFIGLVTTAAGSTWNNSGGSDVAFRGGITKNATGTFTAGNGVYKFETTASQALTGTFSIPNVTVDTGVTLTNNNSLTVSTALSGAGGLTQAASATLNIGGTSGVTTLNATNSGNTVNYTGTGQTVHTGNYHHLTLSGSGTDVLQTGTTAIGGDLTLSGTVATSGVVGLTITGNVVLGNGTSFATGAYTHNVTGNWTNNGSTFTATGSTINFNGSGTQQLNTGGTSAGRIFNNLTHSGSGTLQLVTNALDVDGNFLQSGGTFNCNSLSQNFAQDFTLNSGTVYQSGGTLTFDGAAGYFFNDNTSGQNLGAVVVDGSTKWYALNTQMTVTSFNLGGDDEIDISNQILTITGSGTPFVINTGGQFDKAGSTVIYTGSAATNIATVAYNNLTFTPSSGTPTYSLLGNLTGTEQLTGNLTISASATLDVTVSNFNIALNGSWSNSGNFTAQGGTVTFAGTSGTKTIAPGGSAFNHVVINDSGGTATFRPTANMTVNADFTLTDGILDLDTNDPTMQFGDDSGTGNFTLNGGSITNSNSAWLILNDNPTEFDDNVGMTLGNVQIGMSPAVTNLKSNLSATNLTVASGDTYNTHGWDVTLTGYFDAQGTGTVDARDVAPNNAGNATIFDVGGNWTMSSSRTFTQDAGATKVFMNSTSGADTNRTMTTGGLAYEVVELKNAGATNDDIIISGNLDVNSTFTLTDGEIRLNSGNPNVNTAGNVSVASNAAITKGSGTWTFDGGTQSYADSTTAPGQDLGAVTIGPSTATSLSTGNKMYVTTITSGTGSNDTFDISDDTLTIGGTGTPFTKNGTFTVTNSTVIYTGTTTATNITTTQYNNLTLTPSGSTTYSLTGDLTSGNAILGNLTISTNATLDNNSSNKYNIALAGNWSNSGTFTHNSGGSVTFNTTATGKTIDSGGTGAGKTFYDVVFNSGTGGWTLQTSDINVAHNLTITDISAWTLESGRTIEVDGVYSIADAETAATTWTGSTLYLNSATNYTVGSKTQSVETYDTLQIGANTDIRMWQSSASTYSVDSSGSLYSQDHANVDGDAYIWGDFHTDSNDYWSYAKDFDGTSLSSAGTTNINPNAEYIYEYDVTGNGYASYLSSDWSAFTAGQYDDPTTFIDRTSNTFDLSSLSGQTINLATLYIYTESTAIDSITVSGFSEGNEVTLPGTSSTVYSRIGSAASLGTITTGTGWKSVSVTSFINDHKGGTAQFGYHNNAAYRGMYSAINEANKAYIYVEYGSSRQVDVRIDPAAKVTIDSGDALEVIGTSGNRTTISRQGSSNGFEMEDNGGTINIQYSDFDYLDGPYGLNIKTSSTVTDISNCTFENLVDSGTSANITVDTSVIGTATKTLSGNSFTLGGGQKNVGRIGSDNTGYWSFGTTNGEANDWNFTAAANETDPGMLRWNDSTTNTAPNNPSSLAQKKTDDTVITTGGWINETSVKFTATASDTDNPDTLQLCVEKDILGTSFSDTEDSCGSGVAYSGTPVTVTVTISSMTDANQYHWQARVKDNAGAYSSWISYPSSSPNGENERDFGIDTTAPTGGTVKDGQTSGGDLDWNTDGSLTQLLANWTGTEPNSDVSGLQKYEYALRRSSDDYYWTPGSPGSWGSGQYWYDNTTNTSFTASSLNLSTGVLYYITLRTTDNAGNSASINSNGIQVTPTLSFTIGSNTVTFSDLNNVNNWTDSKTTTVTTSTNASGGYTVQGYVTDYLRSLVYVTTTIADFAGDWTTPQDWANFCKDDASDCGFGYTSNDTTIGPSKTNKFQTGTYFSKYEQGLNSKNTLADHVDAVNGQTGAISNEAYTITHKVSTPQTQTATTYQTNLIIIVTANF